MADLVTAAGPPASVAASVAEAQPARSAPAPAPAGWEGHSAVVGYGVAGRAIVSGLRARGQTVVLIDEAEPRIDDARAAGIDAVLGNAASEETLRLASIETARLLFVAIPEPFAAGAVVETARRLNPRLQIIVRAHSEQEHAHFKGLGADSVVFGAEEIARSMIEAARIALAPHTQEAGAKEPDAVIDPRRAGV